MVSNKMATSNNSNKITHYILYKMLKCMHGFSCENVA